MPDDRWWKSRDAAKGFLFEYETLLNYWRVAAQTKVARWLSALVGKPRPAFTAICHA